MPNQLLDGVYGALANATRRNVVARLARGPASVSQLAEPFEMAMPSLLQHLRVLEDAGLAESRKEGRVRIYSAIPNSLDDASDWLAAQRQVWHQRLDRLDQFLQDHAE